MDVLSALIVQIVCVNRCYLSQFPLCMAVPLCDLCKQTTCQLGPLVAKGGLNYQVLPCLVPVPMPGGYATMSWFLILFRKCEIGCAFTVHWPRMSRSSLLACQSQSIMIAHMYVHTSKMGVMDEQLPSLVVVQFCKDGLLDQHLFHFNAQIG